MFKRFFKHDYYSKVLLYYLVFTIILLLSSSLFLINYFNGNIKEVIYKYNNKSIQQMKMIIDNKLFSTIYTYINENFNDKSSRIDTFFNSDQSSSSLYSIYKFLYNSMLDEEHIFSVDLYRLSDDTLISSRTGIVYSLFDREESSIDEYIDQDFIKNIILNRQNKLFTNTTVHHILEEKINILQFAIKVPLYAEKNSRKGCVIVNINENKLFAALNKNYYDQKGSLLILNENDGIIAPNTKQELYNSLQNSDIMNRFIKEKRGFELTKLGLQTYGISWIKSDYKDWRYVFIIPAQILNKQVVVTTQFALMIVFIIILLDMVGINVLTRWLYLPVRRIFYNIKEKFYLNKKETENSEIEIINNIMENLSSKINQMQDVIIENKSLIEKEIVTDIISGKIQDKEEFYNKLMLMEKKFSNKYLSVIVIDIPQFILSNLPIKEKKYIIFMIQEIVNNFLDINNIDSININYHFNNIVSIVNYEKPLSIEQMEEVINIINYELDLNCNIVLGYPTSDLTDLFNMYQVESNLLKYGFIYGYGMVFQYDELEDFEDTHWSLEVDQQREVKSLIRAYRIEKLKDKIDEIIRTMKNRGISYESCRNIILQISGIFLRICEEQDIRITDIDEKNIYKYYKKINSLADYKEWLFTKLEMYKEKATTRNSDLNKNLIENVKDYIEENIDQQITLAEVAEHFHLSQGHLSRTFKEQTGFSFSSYIRDKKFDKGAKMLIDNSELAIKEIARKLGYLNSSYFSKLFKERHGMTPSQYRKKYGV